MNLHTLDYVILLCEDLAVMKAFYHDILSFPVERDWESWIELRAGSGLLTLRKRGCPYDGPMPQFATGVQLAFRVLPSEAERWYAELLEGKVEILEPPRDQEYGHRTLCFKDPEGNILEICAESGVSGCT